MADFRIDIFWPDGAPRDTVTLRGFGSAYEALCWAVQTFDWAKGFIDHDTGIHHHFNPDMTCNGVPAGEIVAEHHRAKEAAA